MNTAATTRTAATQRIAVGSDTYTYRELGPEGGVALVCLPHFTAVIDDWDPRTIDAIAATRRVILFDNRGVGGDRLGPTLRRRDGSRCRRIHPRARPRSSRPPRLLLGRHGRPDHRRREPQARAPHDPRRHRPSGRQRRRSPPGRDGRSRTPAPPEVTPTPAVLAVLPVDAQGRARHRRLRRTHPRAHRGPRWTRLSDRRHRAAHRDQPLPLRAAPQPLAAHPTDARRQWQRRHHGPSKYSHEMAERLPNAKLVIYPASGHGGVFQHYEHFVPDVLVLLDTGVAA